MMINSGDDLLTSVTLLNIRPWYTHYHILPYLALIYPTWIYMFFGQGYANTHYEVGLIVLAFLGLTQVLMCLSCYWSVHVMAFFTCSKVKGDPLKAGSVKAVPTANNGSAEIVKLIKGNGELYFNFQKLKYIFDQEKKHFR